MGPLIGISGEVADVVRYWGTEAHHVVAADYVAAVRAAGGTPVLLPVADAAGDPDQVGALLARVDGLVLTGGDDVDPARYGQARLDVGTGGVPDPARDAFDVALACHALAAGVPTLAICRGLQVLNVALGGTLIQHLPDHPQTSASGEGGHLVELTGETRFVERFGLISEVNSYHHQAVDRLGDGVVVAARADDGTVEAIEVDGAPHVIAVQWHPESLRHRPEHLALFTWLSGGAQKS